MDKDRVVGAAKELKGKIKEEVGKAVGDAKLETDGTADRVEGKIQNAIGGLKDTIKQKFAFPVALRQWSNRPFLKSIRLGKIRARASEMWQRIGRPFPNATSEDAQFKKVAIPVVNVGYNK